MYCVNPRRSLPRRAGVTLIEALVVLAVISLLTAIAGPAVMRARAAAHQIQCANRLKQIGLAAHEHETLHRRIPVSVESAMFPSAVSPFAVLLPFLDQGDVYERIELQDHFQLSPNGRPVPQSSANSDLLELQIPAFVCPSDSVPTGGISYRMCAGTTPGHHQSIGVDGPDAALAGIVSLAGESFSGIVDGTSYTVMFSERLVGDRDPSVYSPRRDVVTQVSGQPPYPFRTAGDAFSACSLRWSQVNSHSSWSGASWLVHGYQSTLYNHVLGPNSTIPDCTEGIVEHLGAFSARSNHSGYVNVVLADGSGRAVSEQIDLTVWRALGTIAGNEVIDEY